MQAWPIAQSFLVQRSIWGWRDIGKSKELKLLSYHPYFGSLCWVHDSHALRNSSVSIFASWVERVCLYEIFCNRIDMLKNRLPSYWPCLFKSENAGMVNGTKFPSKYQHRENSFWNSKTLCNPRKISFLSPRTSTKKCFSVQTCSKTGFTIFLQSNHCKEERAIYYLDFFYLPSKALTCLSKPVNI